MLNGVDRNHGYLKDSEPGWWSKINLKTGAVISRIEVAQEARKAHKDPYHHMHGHTTYPLTSYTKVGDDKKDWYKQQDYYDCGNHCGHKGADKIWSYGGVELFGAGIGGVEPSQYQLVLDLAKQLTPYHKKGRGFQEGVVLLGSPTPFMDLNKWAVDYRGERLEKVPKSLPKFKHVVHLKWPDGGAPALDPEFWVDLWELLPKPGKVLCCCIGGHGRTGTALAALMMVSGDPDMKSSRLAVLTVRAKHCEFAIETGTQLRYLDKLATTLGLVANAAEAQRVVMNKSKDALEQLLKDGEV